MNMSLDIQLNLKPNDVKIIIEKFVEQNYPTFQVESIRYSVSAGYNDPRESSGPSFDGIQIKLKPKNQTNY